MAELLREQRPEATPLELDRIKVRVKARAARRSPSYFARQKGFRMRSRIAITSMLVLGVFMSGTGATLAVSGISSSGSAGKAAYPPAVVPTQTTATTPQPSPSVAPAPTVLGEVSSGSNHPVPTAPEKAERPETVPGDVRGVTAEAPADVVQPARQVAAQGEATLPFTGFAAIPVLLMGFALLTAGFMLRRRA